MGMRNRGISGGRGCKVERGKEPVKEKRDRQKERKGKGEREDSHTRSSPYMRRHLRIFPFRALFNRISRLDRSCYLRWAMNNNEREYILNVSINARGSGVTILANNATGNDGCVDDGSGVGGSDDGDGTGRERKRVH